MQENQVKQSTVMGYLVEESFGNVHFIDLATDYYFNKLLHSDDKNDLSTKN